MLELPLSERDFVNGSLEHRRGKFIQDAFPMLNADCREFILNGITPHEWNNTFGYMLKEDHEQIIFTESEDYMIPEYWSKRELEYSLEHQPEDFKNTELY